MNQKVFFVRFEEFLVEERRLEELLFEERRLEELLFEERRLEERRLEEFVCLFLLEDTLFEERLNGIY
jgi:hypothetical protein